MIRFVLALSLLVLPIVGGCGAPDSPDSINQMGEDEQAVKVCTQNTAINCEGIAPGCHWVGNSCPQQCHCPNFTACPDGSHCKLSETCSVCGPLVAGQQPKYTCLSAGATCSL
jgi:hypothetical protein